MVWISWQTIETLRFTCREGFLEGVLGNKTYERQINQEVEVEMWCSCLRGPRLERPFKTVELGLALLPHIDQSLYMHTLKGGAMPWIYSADCPMRRTGLRAIPASGRECQSWRGVLSSMPQHVPHFISCTAWIKLLHMKSLHSFSRTPAGLLSWINLQDKG